MFLDLKGAFYTMSMEEALGPILSPDSRRDLYDKLSFTAGQREAYESLLGVSTTYANTSRRVVDYVASGLAVAWFSCDGCEDIAMLLRGATPGMGMRHICKLASTGAEIEIDLNRFNHRLNKIIRFR